MKTHEIRILYSPDSGLNKEQRFDNVSTIIYPTDKSPYFIFIRGTKQFVFNQKYIVAVEVYDII